jgi:hypothetical protein
MPTHVKINKHQHAQKIDQKIHQGAHPTKLFPTADQHQKGY